MPKALPLTLLVLLAGALAVYAALLAFLWWKQESLMFYPVPLPADYPLAQEPDVHERTVQVKGATLSVLHLQNRDARGVVFFLHGNAGNLAGWFSNADFYRQAGFDLVMPDYRGFGKSTGHIASAHDLREDVRAVWDAVAAQYAGKRVVLYGRSLGSGLAADLARQLAERGRAPDLTVLVSPYTSIRALTREFYPWVPPALIRYPLDTAAHLPHIRGPVLLVHGENDTLIGVHHAHRLKEVLPSARLLVLPGSGHNDVHDHPSYRPVLREALLGL
ncbi:alpha/beta hydrolase [Ramlibacter montanisoli]|uniref:Alpha/beta fold hydrolase n=1 Tax=Ramlibacter montanisoli TaxID=2732512 RepID=A0A849KI40_9BURK|nr:alpha/beta fold hydrolase [Ramlibacter montanisoli]NNU43733.1 alpha/beta fold hydrolase [Ramlibacter montanisoli]